MPKENIIQYFDETYEFIEDARKTGTAVLIHCQAGMSRSVTVAAAYMMKKGTIGVEQALTMIKTRRPGVAPNDGFLAQLELYETINYELDQKHAAYRRFILANMAEEYNRKYIHKCIYIYNNDSSFFFIILISFIKNICTCIISLI